MIIATANTRHKREVSADCGRGRIELVQIRATVIVRSACADDYRYMRHTHGGPGGT